MPGYAFTDAEQAILAKALVEFDAWCRSGQYTLSHGEWEAWQTLLPKLNLGPSDQGDMVAGA